MTDQLTAWLAFGAAVAAGVPLVGWLPADAIRLREDAPARKDAKP